MTTTSIKPVHTCTMEDLAGVHCNACQGENTARAEQVADARQKRVYRKFAPDPILMRRWFAATRLIRLQDIARTTALAGKPMDSHLFGQLTHASDEYDRATTEVRSQPAITADAKVIVASMLDA